MAALCATVMLLGLSTPALANSGSLPEENATSPAWFDVLFLRPVGFGAFIGGCALFVPAAMITVVTRPTDIYAPLRELVIEPAKYVWVDPLGQH